MEQTRACRIDKERREIAISVLRTYKLAHLPFPCPMPEPMDFCAFPEVLEIIQFPVETVVTEASFACVTAEMGYLIARWHDHIYDMLVARLKHLLPPLPAVLADAEARRVLSLATTVFCCRGSCSRITPLYYPRLLSHHCFTRTCDHDPQYPLHHFCRNIRTKWSCDALSIDFVGQQIISKVVSSCGLDPWTTTTVQMDTLNPKLACLKCITWTGNQCQILCFSWRGAVSFF